MTCSEFSSGQMSLFIVICKGLMNAVFSRNYGHVKECKNLLYISLWLEA